MPRTPEQNQSIKDRRRGKLLTYALKAFALNGYDRTAVDDITKPAKCSHGLFYHYFDSKEAVFKALIDEVLTQEGRTPVKEALELGGIKGLRLFADYAEGVATASAKEVAISRVTLNIGKANNLDPYGRAFQKEYDVERALATLIKQGQEEGKVISGDPKVIATALMDLAQGALNRLTGKPGAGLISADIFFGFVLKGPIEEYK